MDATTVDAKDTGQWGVVYPYGGVLTTFGNEQDAQTEATTFGGTVVRIVRQVCSVARETDAPTGAC